MLFETEPLWSLAFLGSGPATGALPFYSLEDYHDQPV